MPANVKYVLINRSKGWTITPFVFFWGGQLDNPCQRGYRLTSQEDQGYNLAQGCPHLNHTCTPLRQSFYIQTLLFCKHSSKQTNKEKRQQLRLLILQNASEVVHLHGMLLSPREQVPLLRRMY